MKAAAVLAFGLIALTCVSVDACWKTACTPTPSHYDELGCVPVLDEDKCCPIRYECPEREPDADGCQYRGQFYKVGEKITKQFLPKPCDAECVCENWEDENTFKFNCRAISRDDKNAYKSKNKLIRVLDKDLDEASHEPLERCLGVVVSDPAEIEKNKKVKCIFEGNVYKIGERIIPDGVCHECICDEKLKTQDLDIFTPQCQRKKCGMGVDGLQNEYLNQGCVPVYRSTGTTCCPIDWRCPEPKDYVKKSGIGSITAANPGCTFGDLTLRLLDQVLLEGGDNLNCKCYTPPMVHCQKSI